MTDKNELIKAYKETLERFSNLVMPSEDTPKLIAMELEETYHIYRDWLSKAEQYADSQGWYRDLVSN